MQSTCGRSSELSSPFCDRGFEGVVGVAGAASLTLPALFDFFFFFFFGGAVAGSGGNICSESSGEALAEKVTGVETSGSSV